MKKLNEQQRAALDMAAKFMTTSAEQIMNQDDCGTEDCVSCDTRHATAKLVLENPEFLMKVLRAEETRIDAFGKRAEKLHDEENELWNRRDALDDEIAQFYRDLSETLRRGPPELLN